MEKDEQLSEHATQLPEAAKEASTGSLWNKIAIVGFGIILVSTLLVLIFANMPSDQPSEVPAIPVNK